MPMAAYIFPMWFLHQTAHEEQRGWASDDAMSGTATHRAHKLSTDQHYESTGMGTFLTLQNEVRKSTHKREIHHYLSVLCACGCDFSCFRPPFLKDRICLDPAALWSPLWFHCLPSLLFDSHTQTEKVCYSPYICAWEATLQCLVECIFESGSTLKWLVIMIFFLHTCRFSSIWTAGFSTFNVVCVCICADAVRRLHPGATDSEMREVVITWLTGSRDNGKREREEAKRARQAEDSLTSFYFFMYHNHVLNDSKCEDSNDGAFVVWCCRLF